MLARRPADEARGNHPNSKSFARKQLRVDETGRRSIRGASDRQGVVYVRDERLVDLWQNGEMVETFRLP